MTSPTTGRKATPASEPWRSVQPNRIARLPLFLRRCGAWVCEVSLIAVSAAIPFQAGAVAQQLYMGELVPLNLLLATVEGAIAQTLAIPSSRRITAVAPLTNLMWSIAVVTPLFLLGSQWYAMARTGQTLPKRWLQLRVTTVTGVTPGIVRTLLREGGGRWLGPSAIAYGIWVGSGAFPSVSILFGVWAVLSLGEGLMAQTNRHRRALHDLLAGTYVVDVNHAVQPYFDWMQPVYSVPAALADDWDDADGAIASIVLSPERPEPKTGLWHWMGQHPGTTLLTAFFSTLVLVLSSFVGMQIYVQQQTTGQQFRQQQDRVFLSLVSTLTSTASRSVDDRHAALLALATVDDPRVIPFLVDLLSQETNETVVDAIHQALVTIGIDALPYLQKLNQSLRNEIASLQVGNQPQALTIAALRQRATQRAIAKILTIYTGQIHAVDLSRVDLGQVKTGLASFTLVLNQVDLSGIQLRGAILSNANFKGSRFYNPGDDQRTNTYDDWIADLSGADLRQANLSEALLSYVALKRTNLIGAVLQKTTLTHSRLDAANLSGADLRAADLRQATLKNASLTGANLSDAQMAQANLEGANLGRVMAVGLQGQQANLVESTWRNANISRADFTQADLRRADFSSSRLRQTVFRNAQLQNASFKEADLSAADLRGAMLDGADFQGTLLFTAAADSSEQFIRVEPTLGRTGRLQNVDFTRVKNLDRSQLEYICQQGGIYPRCPE